MGTYGVQLVGNGVAPSVNSGGGLGSSLHRGVVSLWFTGPWAQSPIVEWLPNLGLNFGGGLTFFFTSISSSQLKLAVTFYSASGTTVGTVNFTYNIPPSNTDPYYQALHNLIISFDTSINACQAYLDNAALTLSSQSWLSTNAMNYSTTQLKIYQGGSVNTNVCYFGDFWFGSTASFVDMSIASNRLLFINSDNTPVDLGANGQNPFGASPPIYLHTTSAGSVADFISNKGTGGSWSNSGGSMGVVAPPATPINVSATQIATNQVLLSWTAGSGVAASTYAVEYTASSFPGTRINNVGTPATITVTNPHNYSFKVAGLAGNLVGFGSAGQSPFSPTVSVPQPAASLADLFFSPTPYFVDFTDQANRRLFISNVGAAQNLGSDGSAPFGVAPPVFLSAASGTPASFAVNNGRGGPFIVTGGTLTAAASNPPESGSVVTTTQNNSTGKGVLGDYLSGNLYAFNPATYTDNGTAKRWLRRWRALPGGSVDAKRFSTLVIDMIQVKAQVPATANPQVMLRWSDDGGHSWSNYRIVAVGRLGDTNANVKFNRLGSTRRYGPSDRIFELSSADPFSVAIVDADLDVS